MLSILRRQSQLLEKELLDLRQQVKSSEQVIQQKDERIAELENAAAAYAGWVNPRDEVILCRACGKPSRYGEEEEEEPEPEPEPPAPSIDSVCEALDECVPDPTLHTAAAAAADAAAACMPPICVTYTLTALAYAYRYLRRLKRKLRATESRLTMAELEKSLEELKVFTETNRVRRGLTRELDGARSAAKAAAAKAATELAAAKADARQLASQLGATTVEVKSLRDEVKRRDEQIEFLMQVHDASQSCEWVDTTAAAAANDSQMAAAMAGSMSLGGRAAGSSAATDSDSQMAAAMAASMSLGRPAVPGSPGNVALAQGGPRPLPASRRNAGPWQCGTCTLKNDSARTMCEACGSDRP